MNGKDSGGKLGVAMIGGKTSTIGFRALGVDTYAVTRLDEAERVWAEVQMDRYAVIFITEPVYERLASMIAALREEEKANLPVITVLPSVAVSKEHGLKEMRQKVERAVGVDVYET